MSQKSDAQREAFARARVGGLSPEEAYVKAGYTGKAPFRRNYARKLAALSDIQARVEKLREDIKWGGTSDLAPVIEELIRVARTAGEKPSAAQMVAARGLLAEAARLKQMLGDPHETSDTPPRAPPLSNAEWLAKHAPPR